MPASAPHRAGRAQLRHPALQAMNSPATLRSRPCNAIRLCYVEMGSGPGVPGIYPSGGLMARRPLPSAGSRGSVPPRRRYYEALRLPAAHPAALRCLRLAVSRVHPRFAPVAAGCAGDGPGVGHPVLPPGFAEKAEGPPRFLGDPCVSVPRSPTPAGPRAPGRCGAAARPSVNLTTSAPARNHFGAQSRGPLTRCLRFAARVTPAPRKTRFRLPARLCRAGLVTRRVPAKGFCLWLPPFPSFPGALTIKFVAVVFSTGR